MYTPLNPCIDNRAGVFEISLAEITYYNKFKNISSALGNNRFRYGHALYTVSDGYYNICNLSKDHFEPLKMSLSMNSATGLVTLGGVQKSIYLDELGQLLGFRGYINPSKASRLVSLDPDKEYASSINITATELPSLVRHKEIFVHLDHGLSTLENMHNSFPSTLLRTIDLGPEACN